MGLKVLSGILVTRGHSSGNVTIDFRDHSITGTLTDAGQKRAVGRMGGDHGFNQTPCKIVALREIKTQEREQLLGRTEVDHFRINDTEINRDRLEIEWRATGGSEIEEISYLVVGDA